MTDAFTPAEGGAAGNMNRSSSGSCSFSAPERRCSSGSGAVRYTARARGGSRGGAGSGATAAAAAAAAATGATAVVPAAARSLNRMPLELMGTVLEFVDARSLLTAGMVSKPLRNLIEVRKLWKWHFKLKEKTDPDWSMPPPEMQPADWRVCYWQYKKELQGPPICVLRRGDISRRYRWRVGAINKKIPHPHDIHESMMFFMTYRTRAGTEVVVGWQLQIQRFVKNDEDVYFVFVRTEHPVHCVFRISLLNHKYEVFNSRIAAKSFDGKSGGKTGGCLFPVKQMAEQQMGNQLLIEIDVTVFPGGLDRVEPVYQLLACMSDDSQMVSCIIELLGDYVKRSPVSVKAKHYMQTVGGGPLSLVAICENPDAAPLLKASAAGCLWNILDTSCLYITKSTVERIVKVACSELSQHLQMLDGFSKDTPSDQISFVYPPSDALPQAEVRITSVNAMCGLLWNIPVSDENRKLMVTSTGFLAAMAGVVNCKAYRTSHFCCFHLLCKLKLHNCLPKEYGKAFDAYMTRYLAVERDNAQMWQQHNIGVSLSLRDITDFILPLVRSKDLTCVAFGQWALCLYYFNNIDIYGE